MNCRSLYIGSISATLYVLAVVIGGILRHGYSHSYNSISELTVAGSKPLVVLFVLFGLYNLGLILLGLGPSRMVRSKRVRTTLWLVGLIGLFGGLMLVFPQDPRHAVATTGGTLHIGLASLVSLLTIAAAILGGFSFHQVEHVNMARISWALALTIVITGGLTALGVGQGWQTVGVWERLTIGAFLGWLVWFTLKVKWIMFHEII